jgi:formate dehydrogenase major subunit
MTEPLIEDITREFNRGMWTIGYTGQSPERLKLHMANQHTFDRTTLQANGGPAMATTTACRGRAGALRR